MENTPDFLCPHALWSAPRMEESVWTDKSKANNHNATLFPSEEADRWHLIFLRISCRARNNKCTNDNGYSEKRTSMLSLYYMCSCLRDPCLQSNLCASLPLMYFWVYSHSRGHSVNDTSFSYPSLYSPLCSCSQADRSITLLVMSVPYLFLHSSFPPHSLMLLFI